jgi:hypothetical protein
MHSQELPKRQMSLWPKNGLKMSKVYALKELISHAVLSFGFSQPATFDRSFLPPDVIPIPGRRRRLRGRPSPPVSRHRTAEWGLAPASCDARRKPGGFLWGNQESGKQGNLTGFQSPKWWKILKGLQSTFKSLETSSVSNFGEVLFWVNDDN